MSQLREIALNCKWCDRPRANGTGRAAHERHCPKRPGAQRDAAKTDMTTCTVCDAPYELGTLAEHRKTCKGSATAQIAAPAKARLPGIKDLAFDPGPDEPLDLDASDPRQPGPPPAFSRMVMSASITIHGTPAQIEAALRVLRSA